jgi:hypothetical protein
VRACRILLVVLLAGSTLAASPAAADLLRTDPNDYSLAPDIKSARSDVFRGTYSGHKTRIVRISLRFYDRIPWKRVFLLQASLDSKGGGAADYSLQWFLSNGKFSCWLVKGEGLAGSIVLNEKQVVDYDRGRHFVSCAIPRSALQESKSPRWRANASNSKNIGKQDRAPNKGWFSHL